MTQEQIEQLLATNEGKIAEECIDQIRERLADADEGTAQAAFRDLKSPGTATLLAILGPWDRLIYLKEVGMGILKWITCGGCWIWWIIDMFTAGKRARKFNADMILSKL
jgi:hypothetical protein